MLLLNLFFYGYLKWFDKYDINEVFHGFFLTLITVKKSLTTIIYKFLIVLTFNKLQKFRLSNFYNNNGVSYGYRKRFVKNDNKRSLKIDIWKLV